MVLIRASFSLLVALMLGALASPDAVAQEGPARAVASGSQSRALGGPDAFGYTWIDSNEVGGPVYTWQDIETTGTPVDVPLDECQQIPIGFAFPFYGSMFTDVWICSAGYLAFGTVNGSIFSNAPIPSTGTPDGLIAGYWDDLDTGNGAIGTVTYASGGGRLTVQFTDVPLYEAADETVTFQMMLDADGSITMQYQSLPPFTDDSATIGIESLDGTDGLQVAYNTAYAAPSLAVRFTTDGGPPPPSGTATRGGFDAYGYRWISSDDPRGPFHSFEDIAATGTLVEGWTAIAGEPAALDEGYVDVPFPDGFTFSYRGQARSSVRVHTNGFLTFSPFAGPSRVPVELPSPSAPDDLLAPFWADLTLMQGGRVYMQRLDSDASNPERWIVQYDGLTLVGTSGTVRFQVALYEEYGTPEIEFRYDAMPSGSPTVAAVGIQGTAFDVTPGARSGAGGEARVDGLGLAFDEPFAQSGTTINLRAVAWPPPFRPGLPSDWHLVDRANGIPSDSVTALLAVGGEGRWIGTPEGLVRLNAQLRPDALMTEVTTGLPSRRITGLAASPDSGQEWVGTDQGIGAITIGNVSGFPGVFGGGATDSVTVLHGHRSAVPNQREVWVGTEAGLYLMNLNAPSRRQLVQAGPVRAITESVTGDTLWVAIYGPGNPGDPEPRGGIYQYLRIDPGSETEAEFWDLAAFFSRPTIGLCLENTTDLDWDGTYLRAPYVMYGSNPTTNVDYCSETEGTTSLVEDRRGRMGTYNGQTWVSTGAFTGGQVAGLLPSPEGAYRSVDVDGNRIWLATEPSGGVGGGLYRATGSPGNPTDWTAFRASDPAVGLPSDTVTVVQSISPTRLWMGTPSGAAILVLPDILDTPAPIAPADGVTNTLRAVRLRWESVSSAYDLQVSTSPGFGSLLVDEALSSVTSYVQSGLDAETTYYWRVRARSSAQPTSAWSATRAFTTGTVDAVEAGAIGALSRVAVGEGGDVWGTREVDFERRTYTSQWTGSSWTPGPTLDPDVVTPRALSVLQSVAPDGTAWLGGNADRDVQGPSYVACVNARIVGLPSGVGPEVSYTYFNDEGEDPICVSVPRVSGFSDTGAWACRAERPHDESDGGDSRLIRLLDGNETVPNPSLGCDDVAAESESVVWVADGASLSRYTYQSGTPTTYTAANSPLPSGPVQAVARLADGTVWAATPEGLASFQPATDTWAVYPTPDDPLYDEGFSRLGVADGAVWLVREASPARLFHVSLATGAWTSWGQEEGLPLDPTSVVALSAAEGLVGGGSGWRIILDGADSATPSVAARVLLQGPASGGAMATALADAGHLPAAQPFDDAAFTGTPLAYAGTETATPGLTGVVDWLLVELRATPTGPAVARRAALLLADGQVVDTDGTSAVAFDGVAGGAYHVVVRHRNHLPVMSAAARTLGAVPAVVDFTASLAVAYSTGGAALRAQGPGGTAPFALWAGDGDVDGRVLAGDLQTQWRPQVGHEGYFSGDFDLDGRVLAGDAQVTWRPNVGSAESQVPEAGPRPAAVDEETTAPRHTASPSMEPLPPRAPTDSSASDS